MTDHKQIQDEHERQSQVVQDKIWAVTTTGDTITYKLADYTPPNGYTYLGDVMSRYDVDEQAILDSLRGSCDHRVVGEAILDKDTGEVEYIELESDLPRV